VRNGRIIVAVMTLALIRLVITGQYKHYVRVHSARWLILAGAALGVVLVAGIAQRSRPVDQHGDAHDHAHDHDHSHVPTIAWLMLLPIAVAFVVAPPALGTWGLDRSSNESIVASGKANYTPLIGGGVHHLSTNDFVARAFDSNGSSLGTTVVSIDGLVASNQQGHVVLARYMIACCAADAVAAQVNIKRVRPASIDTAPLAVDRWIRVTGTFGGFDADGLPILSAQTIESIPEPANAYET
jgi:uncharacterized repeat protein (TIGR03943 family)